MATVEEPAASTGRSSRQFVFRAVDEVGATLNAALVVMGDKLGLYRAMAGAGPLTPAELAERTGTAERYVREWLNAQAAGGYVEYDPASGRYTLPPEQAVALTDEDSPAYLPGFFQIALGSVLDSPRITEAARSGEGVGWHEHVPRRATRAASASSGPATTRTCVASWLPALDGVVEKLERGATRRRRRLRPRRVDDPDGAGVPELDVRRLRLPRRVDRDGARSAPRRRASPTASRSRSRRRRHTPARATTS